MTILGRSKMCNTMAATSKQNEIHPESNFFRPHAASSLWPLRWLPLYYISCPGENRLICFFFFPRWPGAGCILLRFAPGLGRRRTASRTMRMDGHCCPRACKTWTCTMSNTIDIKETISFPFISFISIVLLIVHVHVLQALGPSLGCVVGPRGGRPGSPNKPPDQTRHRHGQHHLTAPIESSAMGSTFSLQLL